MSDHSSPVALALAHIESGDLAGAQHCLERESDSVKVGAYYAELTKILYARNKDVRNMLDLGRAGMEYLLRQAERVAADDASLSIALRKAARTLAFNVAANCWPGWDDEGVVIGAADIADGLELAKLSLGLGQELTLGQAQLGTAHWLVGALDLAAGRTDAAVASFDRARACYLSGGKQTQVLLIDGYLAIARSATEVGDGQDVRLDDVVGRLQQDGSENAKFFANQLRTAARILRDRSSP
jgi:hypothetical protein